MDKVWSLFGLRMMTSNVMMAVALLLFAMTPAAHAQSVERECADRTLSVTGQGVVYGVPDVLQARIAVETEDADLSEALAESNARTSAVIDRLTSLGTEERDIRTEDLFIRERRDENGNFVGFLVTNALQVTIRQVDQAGAVLDQAIQAGANAVSNLQFAINDPSSLLSQARQLAVKAAEEKAEEIAQAAGITLGEPVRISEFIPPDDQPLAIAEYRAADATEIPIVQGQRAVRVNVDMTFEINPQANPT